MKLGLCKQKNPNEMSKLNECKIVIVVKMEAAAKKSTKKTTTEQFGVLVLEMEKNPELAKGTPVFGASRIKVDEKWQSISVKVNSYGPPQGSALEWRKIWADLKSRTKKKISENAKSLRETGGGPFRFNPLTEMEQAIDRILHLSTAAQPRGVDFGVVTAVQPSSSSSDAVVLSPRIEVQAIAVVTPTRGTPTRGTPTRVTPMRARSPLTSPIQAISSNVIQARSMQSNENVAPKSFKRKKNYLEEQGKLIRLEIKNQQATIEEMKKQNVIAQAQADAMKVLAEAAKAQAEATNIQAQAIIQIAEATAAHAENSKKIAATMQEVLELLKN